MTSQKILGHLVHLGHLGHLAWRSKNPDYQMTQISQMTYLFGRVIFGEVEKKGRNEHFIGRARKPVNREPDCPQCGGVEDVGGVPERVEVEADGPVDGVIECGMLVQVG